MDMNIVWFLLIGLAAGWLAGQIMKGGGFGVVGDLVVGVIGAILGGFLFGLLGLSASGLLGSRQRRGRRPIRRGRFTRWLRSTRSAYWI